MKKFLFLFLALTFLLAANSGLADDKPNPKKGKDSPSIGMKLKLELSEKMLAALAEGNYESLGENARAMRVLNQIEGFVRRKTPGYQTQLKVFQFATEELVRNAESKNIDGATLSFTQMTISCVQCHKAIRE